MEENEEIQKSEAEDELSERYNRMLRFMDVGFDIEIELGSTNIKIREILELKKGSIISLSKSAGEAIEIYANGKLIAKGEVIVLENNFGIRVTDIVKPE